MLDFTGMPLTLTGYSTALYATWLFVEEHGLLFDAGDGVVSGLTGKIGKIKHIFVTHSDRDHVTGLLQLLQLDTRPGMPHVYYPKDSRSFPAMKAFIDAFDPQSNGATWIPIEHGTRIEISKNTFVEAQTNAHIAGHPGKAKSLSFFLVTEKRKLKPQLSHMTGAAIGTLRAEQGEDAISDLVTTTHLAYSGDTPVGEPAQWRDAKILVHEATFLEESTIRTDNPSYNLHSHLPGVIEMAAQLDLNALVLTHFSTRYTHLEIKKAIQSLCLLHGLTCPVHAILPAHYSRNILQSENLNLK